MDLTQRKLTKTEWASIEVPVNEAERRVLALIQAGYHDVAIRTNPALSLLAYLKVDFSEKMEDYIYSRYLQARVERIEAAIVARAPAYVAVERDVQVKPNSADRIRLDRLNDATVQSVDVYESVLLAHAETLLAHAPSEPAYHLAYYTLYKLIRNNVARLNARVRAFVHAVLDLFADTVESAVVIEHAVAAIEKNESLLKYADLELYAHQKEIFVAMKKPHPKLVLYMAPTGTGKTMTPVALAESKKVIFVCAARHVGLALARAAISVGKRVAFAFGCESAGDIRLHYFAAKDFARNKKTGGIGKVDNSVGDKVEIMICDIRSYLPAMYYMMAFFPTQDMVLYWDEPTITLDYAAHEFHATIHANWAHNQIPHVVLSSATLPKAAELTDTIADFLRKFAGAEVVNIVSHDCKKSIPILSKDGYVVLPHYLHASHADLLHTAAHCANSLTLLRYFDLAEVVAFVAFVHAQGYAPPKLALDRHFFALDDVTMTNIKVYYIQMLLHLRAADWPRIYAHFMQTRRQRICENTSVDAAGARLKKAHSTPSGSSFSSFSSFSSSSSSSLAMAGAGIVRTASVAAPSSGAPLSGNSNTPEKSGGAVKSDTRGKSGGAAYITTKDAYTLTDGPTIFLSDEIEKMAKFCVQQANIPALVMEGIMKHIEYNNLVNVQIAEAESQLEILRDDMDQKAKNSTRTKTGKDTKKIAKDVPEEAANRGGVTRLTDKINALRAMVRHTALNDAFVPNTKTHLAKWAPVAVHAHAFSASIDPHVVADIMCLVGVENLWKVLLMMGIGVFATHTSAAYTEIMKSLADEQKLYMIIATSDYIYGTNYQFCHGYLGKDLCLTQEKVIQAMGRIGRNNVQQTYTVRFRDDAQILKLFTDDTAKPEVRNMNTLFHSDPLFTPVATEAIAATDASAVAATDAVTASAAAEHKEEDRDTTT